MNYQLHILFFLSSLRLAFISITNAEAIGNIANACICLYTLILIRFSIGQCRNWQTLSGENAGILRLFKEPMQALSLSF